MSKNRDISGRNPDSTCDRPQDWEGAVSAAYLRFIDHEKTQAEVAEIVGASPRTIVRWEASDWWPKATAEALNRWCSGLVSASAKTLIEAVENGDAQSARWALERLLPVMAPPTQRVEAEVSFSDVVAGHGARPNDDEKDGVTLGDAIGRPRPDDDEKDAVGSTDAIGHPRPYDDEKDCVGLTDAIGRPRNTSIIGHPGAVGAKERDE